MNKIDPWLQESVDIFNQEQRAEKRREFYELQEQKQRMNRKINELMEEAIIKGLAKEFKENDSAEMNTPSESFVKAFAELIIQDCITVIQKNQRNANTVANSKLDVSDDLRIAYGSMGNMADKCIKDIKEHFGIEQ